VGLPFIMKNKTRYMIKIFFSLISIAILVAMFVAKPKRYGDGQEYFLMTESLFNHGSPDLQEEDINTLEELKTRFNLRYNLDTGYFIAKDNHLYCYHFWAYPLFCLPAKFFLHILQFNELKALQITNAMMYILSIFHIIYLSNLTNLQKMFFGLLVVFCPAFWYIHWTHPEIFSYSLVIMSLAYMNDGKWHASILCAAIASTQNQPLLIWVAFLFGKASIGSKLKWNKILLLSVSALPAITPIFFYYTKFGVPSLLSQEAANLNNISLLRVWEMFFDLNIGLMPYAPLMLLVFIAIVVQDLFLKRQLSLPVQMFLVIFVMMLLCSLTYNWNSGSSGPTRYLIWMLPLFFYVVISKIKLIEGKNVKSFFSLILSFAVLTQALGVIYWGGFIPLDRIGFLQHSYLAKFVLNYFPSIYNPTEEIFIERTLQSEGGEFKFPIIFFYKGKCKKALLTGNDGNELFKKCGHIPNKYRYYFEKDKYSERLVYINY